MRVKHQFQQRNRVLSLRAAVVVIAQHGLDPLPGVERHAALTVEHRDTVGGDTPANRAMTATVSRRAGRSPASGSGSATVTAAS
jgi:hypothetical protein